VTDMVIPARVCARGVAAARACPRRLHRLRASLLALVSALVLGAGASATAAPGAYVADAARSRLQFTGVQAGAEFKAVFHKFTAVVDFAPEALATAHFDVTIDLNSVDSGDKDRDGTMRGPDIFDVAHFSTAHYVTRGFTKNAAGYTAQGTLTLRGVSKDVNVECQFTSGPSGATLTGTATLKRLDFGVGQGDWKNTEWIGDLVKIDFSLALSPRH